MFSAAAHRICRRQFSHACLPMSSGGVSSLIAALEVALCCIAGEDTEGRVGVTALDDSPTGPAPMELETGGQHPFVGPLTRDYPPPNVGAPTTPPLWIGPLAPLPLHNPKSKSTSSVAALSTPSSSNAVNDSRQEGRGGRRREDKGGSTRDEGGRRRTDHERGSEFDGHEAGTGNDGQRERRVIQPRCSSQKDASEATLLRFLRARNLNAEKAATMWCNYVTWRATFVPLGHIPRSKCENELVQHKTYLQGWDKQGRPLVVVQLAKHRASKRSLEELKCTTVYCADKICASMKPGLEQFSVIVDLAGVGYKNLDLSATRAVLHLLQAYYPERLGKIWIIHVPYIFHAFWKIVFIDNKHIKSTLLTEIDEDKLPIPYGGKAELIPIQDSPVPGWPPSG
ncbi:hypothetical protein CBR_g36387 [Chara braunii]|uniref:CRAL-TRIO domain-containing protein n=1 Tax=Chara braunii TaxID=69332 RepID=A0A388LKS9_CHABU|nr:hypothetical protein CBR_g36387 [Chara braunii]|eukprot:GBG82861.1 hypothetical protein CBR_g36387 [Chara braunii]